MQGRVEGKFRAAPYTERKMKSCAILAGILGSGLLGFTLFAQNPFREYPAWEHYGEPVPPDYRVPGEWTFARKGPSSSVSRLITCSTECVSTRVRRRIAIAR